jgi:L-threonylcarbamoyladenylate synthase
MPYVSFPELISRVCSGEAVISFPTDTVPALASRPEVGHLLYTLKQRSLDKPLILLGANATDLWPYVTGTETELAQWQDSINDVWPGALTLVLPASEKVPAAMNPRQDKTIGIRVPNHPIARHILSFTGPLASTSANLSGHDPLVTADDIATQFPDVFLLTALDLERLITEVGIEESAAVPAMTTASIPETTGIPSTVAKWSQQGWEILRQGQIKL